MGRSTFSTIPKLNKKKENTDTSSKAQWHHRYEGWIEFIVFTGKSFVIGDCVQKSSDLD